MELPLSLPEALIWISTLEQVKKEQEGSIKALWRQAKEQQSKLEEREVVSREEVEEALQHNLDLARSEQAQLTVGVAVVKGFGHQLHGKLRRVERQVLDLEAECRTWLQYKDTDSQEHQAQITKLEEELDRMQRDFETEADSIKHALEATLNQIDKETAQLIDEKKQFAAKKAIKHLDKSSKQEIKENEWMQKEIAICNEELSIMALPVQNLEDENLQHINWLFEHRMEDLSLSRNILLTQTVGPSDSEMQKKSLKSPTSGRDVGDATKFLEGDETDRSCSSAPQDLWVLLDRSQSQQLRDERLHLGVPQQMLLSVVGQAVPLHPVPSEDEDDDGRDSRVPKDQGLLTTQIINNKFK
ncbi:coiled-coil domain-containing protein 83 [Centroberyx gerrardi]